MHVKKSESLVLVLEKQSDYKVHEVKIKICGGAQVNLGSESKSSQKGFLKDERDV